VPPSAKVHKRKANSAVGAPDMTYRGKPSLQPPAHWFQMPIVAPSRAIDKTAGLRVLPAGSTVSRWGKMMALSVRPFVSAVLLPIVMAGSCAAADIAAGKATFKKCALCHTAEAGKNKVGPSLFGIVGRKSASLKNYDYSDAMKNFNHVWTPQTLNIYLIDPQAMVPGTKMIFPGIKDKNERADLIAYLETLK
jgi:cytochrome c